MMPETIAITGASGFVGSALFDAFQSNGSYNVKGFCRNLPNGSEADLVALGALETADYSQDLVNIDVVIHTAARAHVMKEKTHDPLVEFRKVNVEGTLRLARQAMDAGVKRFIFISSIGVNGGSTNEEAFNEKQTPNPHTPYARSKFEAELALQELCKEGSMELVIIRPPLVYAAHAPGNFSTLLKVVAKELPLPFSLVKNQRSFVALENLIDFITLCVSHPKAANETFVVADKERVSTPELIRFLGLGMGKHNRLVPVPVSMMKLGAKLVGKGAMYEQLCGSLEVDITKAQSLLNWQPPLSTQTAMTKAGENYLSLMTNSLKK